MESSPPAWQRTLSDFLVERRVVTPEQLHSVTHLFSIMDRRIGQLAVLKRMLSLKDVHAVLALQSEQGLRFGETAIGAGKLQEPQVRRLLGLQKNPSDLFMECFVITRMIEDGRLAALMNDLGNFLAERQKRGLAGARPEPPPESPVTGVREEIRTALKRVKDLGAMPAVVQKILVLTDKPDVEVPELDKAVSADPAMAAQLLRFVNSAALGAVSKLSRVRDAIGRIGIKGLRNVALASVMVDRFKGQDRSAMRRLWMHSVLTAQWAQALAKATGRPAIAEDAFIAGLVHNVGETLLRQFFPDSVAKVDAAVQSGRRREEAEQEVYGQSHADLGAYLCESWSFPTPITQAVAWHHADPAALKALPDPGPVALLVNAAVVMADLPLVPGDAEGNRRALGGLAPELRSYHQLDDALLGLVGPVHTKAGELSGWVT